MHFGNFPCIRPVVSFHPHEHPSTGTAITPRPASPASPASRTQPIPGAVARRAAGGGRDTRWPQGTGVALLEVGASRRRGAHGARYRRLVRKSRLVGLGGEAEEVRARDRDRAASEAAASQDRTSATAE